MPIYEYNCPKCDKTFEKLVFGKDEVTCPKCGNEVQKLMSCCNFKSGGNSGADISSAGASTSSKSSCGSCSATSCAGCH